MRVTPRSGTDTVDGVDASGALRVRVRAAPADGAANKAVIKVIASALGVAPLTVELVSGATSRTKRVRVDVRAGRVDSLWPGLLTRAD